MLVVHVHVHVKPEFIAAFQEASVKNARLSVQEPGIARSMSSSRRMIRRGLSWSRSTARRRRPRGTRTPHITSSGATRWPP